jgi:hypothetical protein
MPSAPFDPNIQSEKIAFDPDQMIACGGCGRMNPPNRFRCLYCAHELEVDLNNAALLRPVLRKLELWERGFNVVSGAKEPNADVDGIAKLLSIDAAHLTDILSAGVPLPLARVESEKEASFLNASLTELGLKCLVIGDADLAPETLPVRLRGMEVSDTTIVTIDFNTDSIEAHDIRDLILAVPGSITLGRVDSLEKRGRGGKSKLLDETATTSDESVLDIYDRNGTIGYRINQTGFDFSCLSENKGLIASENMRSLLQRLKQAAPELKVADDYVRVRHLLSGVWDVEFRNDSQGVKRFGLGKVELGRVASTSNLNQFTKYSRLQRHLYEAQK